MSALPGVRLEAWGLRRHWQFERDRRSLTESACDVNASAE